MDCPGCGAAMEVRQLERRPHGTAELDLCFHCHAIWFDAHESLQLAPGSVIALFRLIHEHRDAPVRPLPESPACPRCRAKLAFTHDLQRTNRINYYRCARGHGRLSTFFQFLREKNFIRSLSPAEVARLQATLKQVRCSSCGGAVSVERDAACPYCRSPLSILDGEAVEKTLLELSRQEAGRKAPADPAVAAVDAALAARRFERTLARIEQRTPSFSVDLVQATMGTLMEILD